jgi:protein-arginine kinase activator protein McsA
MNEKNLPIEIKDCKNCKHKVEDLSTIRTFFCINCFGFNNGIIEHDIKGYFDKFELDESKLKI